MFSFTLVNVDFWVTNMCARRVITVVCACACTCTCLHSYIYACVCLYKCAYVCISCPVCMYACIYVCMSSTQDTYMLPYLFLMYYAFFEEQTCPHKSNRNPKNTCIFSFHECLFMCASMTMQSLRGNVETISVYMCTHTYIDPASGRHKHAYEHTSTYIDLT